MSDVIGLFPLPIVLLPTEHMPLHIFEPRYRELIDECLQHDAPFGFVLSEDERIEEIGTLATVHDVTARYDDGRLDIVVLGGERFRLLELRPGGSYTSAEVEPVHDDDAHTDPVAVERVLSLFDEVLSTVGVEVERPLAEAPQLSFAIAGRFELAAAVKQQLLVRTSEPDRLELVTGVLERALEAVRRHGEIAVRAQGNGRVHHPDPS